MVFSDYEPNGYILLCGLVVVTPFLDLLYVEKIILLKIIEINAKETCPILS